MRNPAIDIMKAIGIFLVIVGHNSSGILNNYIYSFHMPMFFIIAGYLWREKNIGVSLLRDCKRLILPYVAYFVIFAIARYIYTGVTVSRVMQTTVMICWASCHRIEIFGHHIQGVGALWFLPALFVCKNIFNAIHVKFGTLKKRLKVKAVYACMYVCIGICAAIGAFIHRKYFPLPFGLTTGMNALVFFCVGHWIKVELNEISRLDVIAWYYKITILIAWGALGWFVRNGMASCENYHFPLNYVTGICGTILCYYLTTWLYKSAPHLSKALQTIGQYTISVLLIHQLVEDYGWVIKLDYTNHFSLISFTIIIALGYVFGHYFITRKIRERSIR